MPNVFLVIRAVFFMLLTYFHVLILLFASWNIAAAKSSGMSAPGASVFLLINSVSIFVLVPVASLAALICARARPAQVRVECTWTAFMSVLQLAASINVTVNGPAVHCQTHSPWAICASSSLLAQVSWLVTLIIFSYCLTIFVASFAHAACLPDIWVTPVPRVPWFHPQTEPPVPAGTSHMQEHAKTMSSSSSLSEASCPVSKYVAERWEKLSHVERQPAPSGPISYSKGCQSVDSTRPAWARLQAARRGIDNPFTKPIPKRKEPPIALALPPRTHSRQVGVPRDFHPAKVSNWTETTRTSSSCSTLTAPTPTVFPWEITDPDLPIPRPILSEWVRADAVRGLNVHKKPIPS